MFNICNVIFLDKHGRLFTTILTITFPTTATTCKKRGCSIHAPGSVTKRRAHARLSFPLHLVVLTQAHRYPPAPPLFHVQPRRQFEYVIVNAVFRILPVPLTRLLPWEGLDFPSSDTKTIL